MKTYYTVGLSMLAGVGIGAVAVQTLHAQAKPPVYVVTEIDVTNVDAYNKEYVPVVRPIIAKSSRASSRHVASTASWLTRRACRSIGAAVEPRPIGLTSAGCCAR
jgi:hypothetical protein